MLDRDAGIMFYFTVAENTEAGFTWEKGFDEEFFSIFKITYTNIVYDL